MSLALVGDIGGTHARFALAQGGAVQTGSIAKLRTADHATIESAMRSYLAMQGAAMPEQAALAVATAVLGDDIRFTNSPWTFKRSQLQQTMGLKRLMVLNDFGAVARAMIAVGPDQLLRLDAGDVPLAIEGVVSVVGPGTGLGVALLHRTAGATHVVETEGGHLGFAPFDAVEVQVLERLQKRYPRVSAERLVAGPGLVLLHESLAAIEGRAIVPMEAPELWSRAIDGSDAFARAALLRWLQMLGTTVGDIALAQGAQSVVLAGGVLPRCLEVLKQSDFMARFYAKGRFKTMMRGIPVFLCLHPDPGLLGAATALAD